MSDDSLLKHLIELLDGGHAHAAFDAVIKGIPAEKRGVRPRGCPHSPWELLEHMRIAQNDILRFSREPDYVSPAWPEGYWPAAPSPKNEAQWRKSVKSFRDDLAAFQELLGEGRGKLDEPFPWGQGQTLLREALLIADHNAYHLGQLVLVRRLLGNWPAA
jgi:hypothetical protein